MSAIADDLVDILRALCRRPDLRDLSALGTPVASELGSERLRAEPSRFPWLAAIEVRPWTTDMFGVADLQIVGTLSLSELDTLDVVELVPRNPDDQSPTVRVFWAEPELPATAVVYATLVDPTASTEARVKHLTIRTEPR
jgi:hypothetical protein